MAITLTEQQVVNQRTRFFRMIPVYVLVPIGFWFAFTQAGFEMHWAGFGLGALGWWVALLLRAPLALVLQRTGAPQERAKTLVVGFSGPAEEVVRWGLILWTGGALPWAASVGQGWAAIEVLFAVVQGIVMVVLIGRQDEKAAEARAFLAANGYGEMHPVVGVLERISASGIHIGFTLLVAKEPWLVPVLMVAHSAVNLSVVRLMGAPWKQQALVAATGLVALPVGLYW